MLIIYERSSTRLTADFPLETMEARGQWDDIFIQSNGNKRWEYQTTLPASRETCMQVKKQQVELVMGQLTYPLVISKRQTTHTMRCHLVSTRMTMVKKQHSNSLGKMWRNWNPSTLLVRKQNYADN